MHVVLLHDDVPPGAPPDQTDVSSQADAVAAALAALGHRATRLSFSFDLQRVREALRGLAPDAVFNLVESVEGQGRFIYLAPALLDGLLLPYTGAHTQAMFVTSNKVLAKRLLRANGIATPAWADLWNLADPGLVMPGSYIIKSVWEDASVGLEDDSVVWVSTTQDLQAEIRARAAYLGGEVFAECYVPGREFNLSLLGGPADVEVLPPAEIRFVDYPPERPRVVGYRAKWDAASFEYQHTPRSFDFPPSDRGLLQELCRLARACWDVMGLRGYARVDFRVDEGGRPWVLEINPNPCLSPDAGFPAAARRAGLSFQQVVERVLGDALATDRPWSTA